MHKTKMKALGFEDNLVPLILRGEKRATWRLYDKRRVRPGQRLALYSSQNGDVFAFAKVEQVRTKRFSKACLRDYLDGHEQYESEAERYAVFRKYYGDKSRPQAPLTMIRFQLLGRVASK